MHWCLEDLTQLLVSPGVDREVDPRARRLRRRDTGIDIGDVMAFPGEDVLKARQPSADLEDFERAPLGGNPLIDPWELEGTRAHVLLPREWAPAPNPRVQPPEKPFSTQDATVRGMVPAVPLSVAFGQDSRREHSEDSRSGDARGGTR